MMPARKKADPEPAKPRKRKAAAYDAPPSTLADLTFVRLGVTIEQLGDIRGIRKTMAMIGSASLSGKIPIEAGTKAIYILRELAKIDLEEARLDAAKKMGVPFVGMQVLLAPPRDADE